jgi:uncharacterized membrane protein
MVIVGHITWVVKLFGVAVICWGVLLIFLHLIRLELGRLRGRRPGRHREAARHQLGSYLLLGLEFLIAADIIETITHPTLQEVALLGGIVVIRTVISYFLDRELAHSHPGFGETPAVPSPPGKGGQV